MKLLARILSFLLIYLLPGALAWAQGLQDLVGGKEGGAKRTAGTPVDLREGRNRIDLALSPAVRIPRSGEERSIGFSSQADLRMICGQYDLKATFKNLLGKEAREEFLDGLPELLVQELVGSAMDLICQAEPTLCNLIQNYSVSANLKLGYYKDLCQAIEHAVTDAQRKSYANSVDACLKEKQSQGYPLDKAMEACQKGQGRMTGFRGEVIGQLDLGKALKELLRDANLSPGAQELLGRLSEETKVGALSISSNVDPNAVAGHYEAIRRKYQERLGQLLGKAARRERIPPEEIWAAVPPDLLALTEDELRTMSLASPAAREAIQASLSSALALSQLSTQIHEVERALEAVRGAPTVDPAKGKLLDDRLARLRAEKTRLQELYRDQAVLANAVAGAKGVAERELADRVTRLRSRADAHEKKHEVMKAASPWGAPPPPLPASPAARSYGARTSREDCGNCGLEYSFGSAGKRP